jgi:L-fucono-1,5-lactonase
LDLHAEYSRKGVVSRRRFLGELIGGFTLVASSHATQDAEVADLPIIDTHIHLFDTARPQGVPWPTKEDGILFQPALPERYQRIVSPHSVRGAIAIEASPWLGDNQWLLDAAATNAIIVGVVGNLEPGKPGFRGMLEALARNSLFLGLRYGNLWGRKLNEQLEVSEFVSDLRFLASLGLSLDTADPDAELMADVVRLSDTVPNLRIIIDHLPQITFSGGSKDRTSYAASLQELRLRAQVFVKLSEVLQRANGQVSEDVDRYRATLDEIVDSFGFDRVLYGSDWPNCDMWAPYSAVLRIVRQYFEDKDDDTTAKFFWRNSIKAYRWVHRSPSQAQLQ